MKKIITIGREFGAGGSSIGRAVAAELGIAYYDRDIILRTAAASANLSPEEVRQWDEKVPREFGVGQSLFYSRPLSEQLWQAQVAAIREMADRESCVIVGRNADYILREFDHTLRVFLHADLHWRLMHMMDLRPGKTMPEVAAELEKSDKARAGYCKRFTGTFYGDARNYDLTINTGKVGFEKATQLVLDAAKDL